MSSTITPQDRYSKILGICKRFIGKSQNPLRDMQHPGRPARMQDVEVLAVSLLQEELGYCSERDFFLYLQERYPKLAAKLGTRRNYNNRRKNVQELCERFRSKIARKLKSLEGKTYIVDSMPIPICRKARIKVCSVMHDNEYAMPNIGFCASQSQQYFGYKLHVVCTPNGVIMAYDLSAADKHDARYLLDIEDQFQNCLLLGDKGYRSKPKKMELFEFSGIRLETPCRYNEKDYVKFPANWGRIRKRIEVLFSQLVENFQIRRIFAKSTQGLFTRVKAKVAMLTIQQYVNVSKKKTIGHVKHALAAFEAA